MEKRTMLALALSFLILGFYPVLLEKFYPNYKSSSTIQKSGTEAASLPSADIKETPVLEAYDAAADVFYRNSKLDLIFNRKDASLRKISFLKFLDSDSKPLNLMELAAASSAPFSLGLRSDKGPSLERFGLAQIDKSGDTLTAFSENQALAVTKSFSFEPDGYSARLKLHFKNRSTESRHFAYELFAGPSIQPRHSIDSQYVEANFFSQVGDKFSLKHIKESKLGKRVSSEGKLIWIATKDRHFSVILKPENASFTGAVRGLGNHRFAAALDSGTLTLEPGGVLTHDFLVYIGPNDLDHLLPLGLDALVNFGKFDWIGKLLVGGLELLHKIFRNYGLSIIALTSLINLLLFPLTRNSYLSMKRMQLIQPQMNKLKEQHKKNPEKLNKEMMELYKKHKVNPFGGCLPLILQMPVFIALYVALSKSVILINSLFLWVKDLSSPDGVRLPVSLPFLGNEIHVLPLVMVAAMVFQQKLTQIKTESPDPTLEAQQKMMFVMMPIVFGFIFYSMPSGLVLYWLTNTLLMTAYQLHLKKMTIAS